MGFSVCGYCGHIEGEMSERKIANRYTIEKELGRGGMAVVYRAWDTRLKRHVALKLLHPYLATQPESAARFLRESNAIAKLDHPNIIKIYDADRDEESKSQFLVMELVEGPTLNAFIDAHPTVIPEMTLAMACCLCDAIEHAHKAGIIHRDIKPENIMIASDGTLKLMDFGIARVLDDERMTASGSLVGSPAHMPPEIIEGQSYTFTCDIFSLGTVIYYMLTNILPFRGTTPMAVFKAILDGKYQQPSRLNQSISKDIDKVVAKCLMVNPEMRFQDVADLKEALLDILKPIHFDNYVEIASRYVLEPVEFTREVLPSLKSSLNEAALVAVKEHRFHAAIEYLNCILTYSPDDPDANALLKRLRTGNLLRKRLIFSGITVVALLLVAAVVYPVVFLNSKEVDHPQGVTQSPASAPNYSQILALRDDREFHDITSVAWVMSTSSPYEAMTMISGETFADKTDEPEVDFYDDRGLSVYQPDNQGASLEQHEQLISSLEPNGTAPETQSQPNENHEVAPEENKPQTQNQVANNDTNNNEQKNGRSSKNSRKQSAPAETSAPVANPVAQPTTQPATQPAQIAKQQPVITNPKQPAVNTKKVRITQPIYPPDAFAVINGKRFDANSSGDIVMELPPGKYKMTLSCSKRCVQQTTILTVLESGNNARDVISLEWADASIILHEPDDGTSVYFVARRLDDVNHRVFHFVPRVANAVNGFNAFGKPIQLEVYAIPTSNTLKSYDANALERAKYASTRVSLSPGEARTVRF